MKARVWLIEDGKKQRIWPIENDKIFIEYKGEPPRNPIRVIAIDDIRPLVEALKGWIEFERRSIKLNGPYSGKEITELIKHGEAALATLPHELLASEGADE